jgi:hypothetical protein
LFLLFAGICPSTGTLSVFSAIPRNIKRNINTPPINDCARGVFSGSSNANGSEI